MAVRRICEAIVRDEKSILPVSVMLDDQVYGLQDVVLSMPAMIGARGAEGLMPITLNEEEQAQLKKSAQLLKEVIDGINI